MLFSSINLFSIHQLSTVSLGNRSVRSGSPSQGGEGDRGAVEVGDSLPFSQSLLTVEKFMGKVKPTSSAHTDTRSRALKAGVCRPTK